MSSTTIDTQLWPKPREIYYHFKRQPVLGIEHGAYLILGVAKNTEDRNQHFVVTKPLYFCDPQQNDERDVSFLVRPVEYFYDYVDRPSFQGKRFELITDDSTLQTLRLSFLYTSSFLDK